MHFSRTTSSIDRNNATSRGINELAGCVGSRVHGAVRQPGGSRPCRQPARHRLYHRLMFQVAENRTPGFAGAHGNGGSLGRRLTELDAHPCTGGRPTCLSSCRQAEIIASLTLEAVDKSRDLPDARMPRSRRHASCRRSRTRCNRRWNTGSPAPQFAIPPALLRRRSALPERPVLAPRRESRSLRFASRRTRSRCRPERGASVRQSAVVELPSTGSTRATRVEGSRAASAGSAAAHGILRLRAARSAQDDDLRCPDQDDGPSAACIRADEKRGTPRA